MGPIATLWAEFGGTMTVGTFDTLAAARDLEAAGVGRPQAEAIASAIRNGQGEFATRADTAAIRGDIAGLRWIVGLNVAISLAALAAVLASV